MAAGIDESQLVLDPGLGFGKTAEQNLALLARLGRARRPRPAAAAWAPAARASSPATHRRAARRRRLGGSLAAVAWAAAAGVAIVRVHDVAETVQFLDVW